MVVIRDELMSSVNESLYKIDACHAYTDSLHNVSTLAKSKYGDIKTGWSCQCRTMDLMRDKMKRRNRRIKAAPSMATLSRELSLATACLWERGRRGGSC